MAHAEERLLGRARARVAFNAAIAARSGLSPRISVLEAEGRTIGMGTDNMAEDMVEAMRRGLVMERIHRAWAAMFAADPGLEVPAGFAPPG